MWYILSLGVTGRLRIREDQRHRITLLESRISYSIHSQLTVHSLRFSVYKHLWLQVIVMSSLPSDPAGPTGKLCNWVQGMKLEDVPEQIQQRAKYLILDGLGCAIVGAHLPWSKIAAEAVFAMEGGGDCTIIGWDKVCATPYLPLS